MSGRDYPLGPQHGSNGIGLFQIGVSPIGTIPSFDIWSTVISQYANSDILTTLITNLFDYIDPTKNLESFFDLIWNVDTAEGYGLDVWGRIVGVNRILQVSVGTWFGFQEALPGIDTFNDAGPVTLIPGFGFQESDYWQPFNQAQFGLIVEFDGSLTQGGFFYSGQKPTDNYRLSDQAYRQLILTKAAANITDGSIPAINRILMSLFPNRGNCFVTDGYQGSSYFGFEESQNALTFGQESFYSGQTISTMVMTYVFQFPLSPVEQSIVLSSGVLPKSTGVASNVVIE